MTELQDHSPQPSGSTVSGGGPGTYNQKEERAREGELHTEPSSGDYELCSFVILVLNPYICMYMLQLEV